MKPLDFLAIGDIVIDAFIRLKDASVTCDINRENCQICMPFAEKIPFEFVEVVSAVGNGPNAAVSAARLGLNTGMMTDVGKDDHGKECIVELKKNGVSTKFVSMHRGKKTNYHYVLWFEDERTILVKHEDFAYRFYPPRRNPRWVYITSLGANALDYQLEIGKWLEENPDIKVAFQPGTFQMNAGYEKLGAFYRRAEIFFCNVEEAKRILKKEPNTGDKNNDVKELMRAMHELGPKNIVITDGPRGAYAFDGTDSWFMPTYPDPKPPYERTGAGDAFASTVTAALALGKPLSEALTWGPINSMSVVQDIGAQRGLLKREKLEEYLRNAPADYLPRKI
jgi:ribokinase